MSAVDADVEEQAAAPSRKGGRWLWILPALVVLAGAGAAGAWWAGLLVSEEREPRQLPAQYFTVDSNLVVNFQGGGRMRYLQVGIQLMTRDPKAIEAMAHHAPVIRHHLILLLSQQSFEDLVTADGKQRLQDAALAEVQRLMTELYGQPAVESLYFTSFMMQ